MTYYNDDIELEFLATCIQYPKLLETKTQEMKSEYFGNAQNALAWKIINNMHNKNIDINIISVIGEIKKIDNQGNDKLLKREYGFANAILDYIKQIKYNAYMRKTQRIGKMIAELVDHYKTEDEIKLHAQELIEQLNDSQIVSKEKDLKTSCFNALQKMEQSVKGDKGLQTGYKILDNHIVGLEKGQLVVIAARPSMGKTAFSFQILKNICVDQPGLMFSLEMTSEALAARYLAQESAVSFQKIRTGTVNETEAERVVKSYAESDKHKIYIYDIGRTHIRDIIAKIRYAKRKYGIESVVVDHLGYIEGEGNSLHIQIGNITKALKSLAKELGIVIILLSQLSRKCEERTDKRPMLSDLRESGSIEEDADIIMMLYRDDYYNKESEKKGILECIIGKNRDGMIGTIEFIFIRNLMQFQEIPEHTANF